ncbi:MAG TPA: HesA/MoeB/ThiF family protein [Candidatus Dormibacteraeota bacterium]|nr:HesA/MoeB/ThiF family protein [Candidatus Dormibacteraeota bacterium]
MTVALQELNGAAVERYSRQLLLREVGEAGQLRLAQATAVVVGCGGLGVPVALYLGAAGVGHLILIDPDQVSLDNLNRQIAYRTAEVGQPKAALLGARISELNPNVSVETHSTAVTPTSIGALVAAADVVLECSDDPTTKFLVNDYCVPRGKGLVIGGAVGLAGQVVTVPAGGACYRCLFGGPPAVPGLSCRDAGVLGPLVGIIGSLQALEAIKLVCGPSPEAGGRLFDFDAAAVRWREVRFPLDPSCPAHGERTLGNRP